MPRHDRAYIEHLRGKLAEHKAALGWMIDTPNPAKWIYCPWHGHPMESVGSRNHPRATCEGCVYEAAKMQAAIRRDWEEAHPGNLHTTGREAEQVREYALPEREPASVGRNGAKKRRA